MRKVKITDEIVAGEKLFFILGPCVIESEELVLKTAERILETFRKLPFKGYHFIFKSSFDKANRTSIHSFRGPGLEIGLEILYRVKRKLSLPLTTDIHLPEQAEPVSQVVDLVQIPAFLSRQTDLLLSAGKTEKPVNVKKGQFLSPWDLKNIAEKIESTGNKNILFTERGSTFGYQNLVVDMRTIPIVKSMGYPIVIDATHSVQKPGGLGASSGGDRWLAPYIARAGVAVGADAVFMEVHPEPDKALSDGANSIKLDELYDILSVLIEIYEVLKDA